MDKKLTKQEALNLIDQLILKEVERTGRTYLEISREMMQKFQKKRHLDQSTGPIDLNSNALK